MARAAFTPQHTIARLVILDGEQRSTIFPLYADQVIIGRIDSADLQLDDGRVSRLHARVRRQDLGFVLEDLDSRAGTQVNGSAIQTLHRLQDGDHIQVGDTHLLYET